MTVSGSHVSQGLIIGLITSYRQFIAEGGVLSEWRAAELNVPAAIK